MTLNTVVVPSADEDIQIARVPLRRHVTHNGATYAELNIREATVGDQLAVFKPGMSQAEVELALIAHLSGVPKEVIAKVRLGDYQAIQKVLVDFPYSPAPSSPGPSAASPSPSADSV